MTKIFLTIGTQLPFDRLVDCVTSSISSQEESAFELIVQTPNASEYISKTTSNIVFRDIIPPAEYDEIVEDSEVLIAHAGMGSIITALESDKPLIIMARLAKFNEHRNDHQLATINEFKDFKGIYSIENETDLLALLWRAHDLDGAGSNESVRRKEFCSRLNEMMQDW